MIGKMRSFHFFYLSCIKIELLSIIYKLRLEQLFCKTLPSNTVVGRIMPVKSPPASTEIMHAPVRRRQRTLLLSHALRSACTACTHRTCLSCEQRRSSQRRCRTPAALVVSISPALLSTLSASSAIYGMAEELGDHVSD